MKESLRPWEELPLEALLKEPLANGRSVPDGTGFRVLRLTALRNGAFNFSESKRGNWSAEDAARFLVAHGDVFVVRGNGSISLVGRAGFVKIAPPPVAFPDTMIRVRVRSDRILPQFLAVQLEAPRMREQIERAAKTTAGIFKVNQGDLHLLRLVVPPLLDQAQIVSVIETQFSRLDVAIASLERAKANIKRARASVLKAAVEGRLVPNEAALARSEGRDYEPASALLARILAERRVNWSVKGKYQEPLNPQQAAGLKELPEGWAWATLEQLLAESLRNGKSAKAAENGGIRTLTLTAVTQRDFSAKNTKLSVATAEEADGLWLEYGDVFVQRSNTPELVGTTAMYRGPSNWAIFPDLLIRVRCAMRINRDFVEIVLRSPMVRAFFRSRAQGIAGSMPKIDQDTVARVAIPLPPLPEQLRIVAEVDRRSTVLDAVELTVNADLDRCARLRQSILKDAFEGRLVPPEPPATAKSKLSRPHQVAAQ